MWVLRKEKRKKKNCVSMAEAKNSKQIGTQNLKKKLWKDPWKHGMFLVSDMNDNFYTILWNSFLSLPFLEYSLSLHLKYVKQRNIKGNSDKDWV